MQTSTMHTKTTTQDSQSQVDIIPEVLRAIRSKDAGSVENLLSKKRIKGDYRNAAVFEAAVKSGQPELVRCLVRHGVIPLEESPIFSAIKEVSALKVVLAEGYSVNVLSSAMKPPLHVALTLNPSAIPVLLRAGCDVTSRDCLRGNTPLHSACTQCDEDSILRFIQAGCALNCCNHNGETPLFCLLKHAADVRGWRDFHVRTRHSLARCLIHMGMTLTPVTSSYSSDLVTSASCTRFSTSSSTSRLSTSSDTSLSSTSSNTSPFSASYTASRLSTSPNTSQSSTSLCNASSESSASTMTSSATPKEHSGPTEQCTTSTQSFASVSHSPPLPTSSACAATHARPSPSRTSAERRDVMPSNDAARRKGYKVTQVYRRLLGDTRHSVWPLQHLCRVRVRERCEIHLESLQDRESGDEEGRGGGGEDDGGGEEEVEGGERGGEGGGGGEIGEREGRGRTEGGVGGGEVEVGKEEEEEVGEEEQEEQEGGESQEKQTSGANVSQDIVDRGKNRTTESSLQKPVRNLMDAFDRLGVSQYLQDYLLYRHHDLDREAFSVVSKNVLTM